MSDEMEKRLKALEEKLAALMNEREGSTELVDPADVPETISLKVPEGTVPRRISMDLVIAGGSRPRSELTLDLVLMGGSRPRTSRPNTDAPDEPAKPEEKKPDSSADNQ